METVSRKKAPKTGINDQRRFKTHTYVLSKKYNNPTLEGRHYPQTYSLPTEDEVYCEWINKETGEVEEGNRIIRYVPGETSIFADEQSQGAEGRRKRGVIVFTDGILHVKGTDTLKIQFLEMCNWNAKNSEVAMEGTSSIFYKLDLESKAEDALDTKRKIHELEGRLFGMDHDELKALAMTFNVRGYNSMGYKELTNYMIDLMRYDPSEFENELESPDRKKKFYIMKAFEEEYLTLDKDTNVVVYNLGSQDELVKIPFNKDVVDCIVDLSNTKPVVREAVDSIISIFKKEALTGKKGVNVEAKSLDITERLFNQAFDLKVFERKGAWVRMINEGNICKSNAELKDKLKKDKEFRSKVENIIKSIEEDIEKATK